MRGQILTLMIVVFAMLCGWLMFGDGPADRQEATVAQVDLPPADDRRSVAEPALISTATEEWSASLPSPPDLSDDPVVRSDFASITGVVYDISTPASMGATPLDRATVVLSIARPRAVPETIEGHTGPDGRFSLDVPIPASVTLTIKRTDFVPFELPGMVLLASETRDLGRINLPRGGRVLGRVVDEKGLVVGGARVLLGDQVVTTTNVDGAFEIRGLPWGLLSLRAEREGYSSVSGPEIEIVPRVNEELRDVLLHLANYRRIAGIVRDQEGNPLAGAEVTARPATTMTEETSEATGTGYDRWEQEKPLSWTFGPNPTKGLPLDFENSFGSPHDDARESALRSGSLPQWIVEHFARRDGRRPALTPRRGLWDGSVETFHSPSERETVSAKTDPKGRFEVMGELVDRAYEVTVHHRGYDPVEYSIDHPGSEPREIVLTRQPWLTFTVSDPRGSPLTPSVVKVRSDLLARDWTLAEFWSEGDQWYVGCPEIGDWRARVWTPLHKEGDTRVARVLMGETKSVGSLRLSPYDDFCFYVVSEDDGTPIRGAEVTVYQEGVVIRRRSDERGSVCFPGTAYYSRFDGRLLTTSNCEVTVTADGFVPVTSTNEPLGDTVTLSSAGYLEGTVFGFDKKPLAGVPVGFFSKASGQRSRLREGAAPPSAVADSSGRYLISNLPAGRGIVVAGDAMPRAWIALAMLFGTNHVAGESATIVAGEGARHDIELANLYGDVGGQAIVHGVPAAGLNVFAHPVSYAGQPTQEVTAMDGTFRLAPLIPGRYELSISQDGRTVHRTAPFDLGAGDRPRFAIHIETGSIAGSLRVPPSERATGSIVLHEAARFESENAPTSRSLRTLLRPDRSFAFPQVSPGDYVVTGLERDSGVVPTRVTVTAGQTTSVVLEVGAVSSVEIEFDWRAAALQRSMIEPRMQFEIEDRESRLRWVPSVESISADRRRVTGLANCDRLHVTAKGSTVVTIDNPFAPREGALVVTMGSGTRSSVGMVHADPEKPDPVGSHDQDG